MKSREGTVVDADDLIDEMIKTAKQTTEELGKTDALNETDKNELYNTIGLGALKYFILKVDPKKKMLFNPAESIDFHGNTGPFIQYTHARIKSILRKAGSFSYIVPTVELHPKERDLLKLIYDFQTTVTEAGGNYSPAIIANYVYDLAKEFNQFYHECDVIKEENEQIKLFRLQLIQLIARIIKAAMELLGAKVPEQM
jgi:arginyl-tRNA synthetase